MTTIIQPLAPSARKFVRKDWGWEHWLQNSREHNYCLKELHIAAGQQTSIHAHPVKAETMLVVSGKLILEHYLVSSSSREDAPTASAAGTYELTAGMSIDIAPMVLHRLKAPVNLVLLEASTYHDDEDVIRYEDAFYQ